MRRLFTKVWHGKSGTTTLEYAFVASLISMAVFASLGPMANFMTNTFTNVAGNLIHP